MNKINVGIHIMPKTKHNTYEIIPKEKDKKEYEYFGYCEKCNKNTRIIKQWISDPIQPDDIGLKGKKIEPYWIDICQECKLTIDGIDIIKTDNI